MGQPKEETMGQPKDHYVLTDDNAEAIWFLGTLATVKAAGATTGGALTVIEFLHPPGFATAAHVHHIADEAFYILEGAMRGFCGDRSWRATAGSFVWLPRGIPHGYAVDGDEPMRSLAISVPADLDRLVLEVGEPAGERTLPPPSAPDMAKLTKLDAAATNAGITHLGPPGQWPNAR